MQKISLILILTALMVFGAQANIMFNDSQPAQFLTDIQMNGNDLKSVGKLSVTSDAKVENLNAEYIDGKNLTDLKGMLSSENEITLSEVVNNENIATKDIEMNDNSIKNISMINGEHVDEFKHGTGVSPGNTEWKYCDGSDKCTASCDSDQMIVGWASNKDKFTPKCSNVDYPVSADRKIVKSGAKSKTFVGDCVRAVLVCSNDPAYYESFNERVNDAFWLGDEDESARKSGIREIEFENPSELMNGHFHASSDDDYPNYRINITAVFDDGSKHTISKDYESSGDTRERIDEPIGFHTMPDKPIVKVRLGYWIKVYDSDRSDFSFRWTAIRKPYS